MNKAIDDALDLEHIEILPATTTPAPVGLTPIESTAEDDFEYARVQMRSVIDKGQEALSGIVDVASLSQNPRSFEVVATLVSAVASASKDLMELSKRRKDMRGVQPTGPSTVNQNLYVGNTAELLKLLKSKDNIIEVSN